MSNSEEQSSYKQIALQICKNNPDMVNQAIDMAKFYHQCKTFDKIIALKDKELDHRLDKMVIEYQFYHEQLDRVFGEREKALSEHYKTLDYALENNDREVIIASLRGISSIVSKNPLESFVKFDSIMSDDTKTLELDF